MTARYMLDTNICIYIARTRPAPVRARFEALESGEAVISVVTWGELCFGAEKSTRAGAAGARGVHGARGRGADARGGWSAYGAIRSILEAKGTPIGNNDLWIAAHARTADVTLVTNNERELGRVPGLRIENWAEAGSRLAPRRKKRSRDSTCSSSAIVRKNGTT